MTFGFECRSCGEIHEGMPSFAADAPMPYYAISRWLRGKRCSLGTDHCVIDNKFFFVRGRLELPVTSLDEPFVWGVWVSLSEENFVEWTDALDKAHRSHLGPYFAWLNTQLAAYPDTMNLKTLVHLQDHGLRPLVEVEPSEHPLAREQQQGISTDRLAEICELLMH